MAKTLTPQEAEAGTYSPGAMVPVDNWSLQIDKAFANFRLSTSTPPGRMFSIGTRRLGYPVQPGGVGPFAHSSLQPGGNWDILGAPSFATWGPCASNDSSLVITIDTSGTGAVQQSSDLGETWTGAGTISATSGPFHLAYWLGGARWIITSTSAGNNFINSDLDLSGIWPNVSAPAEVLSDAITVVEIAQNTTEVLIPYSNGYIARTTNGTSWTASLLPSFTGQVMGCAYNEVLKRWGVCATGGKTWFSTNGVTWIAGPTLSFPVASPGERIAALGHYWVAPVNNNLYRFNMTAGVALDETLTSADSSASDVTDIYRHGNRLVASWVDTPTADLHFKLSARSLPGIM